MERPDETTPRKMEIDDPDEEFYSSKFEKDKLIKNEIDDPDEEFYSSSPEKKKRKRIEIHDAHEGINSSMLEMKKLKESDIDVDTSYSNKPSSSMFHENRVKKEQKAHFFQTLQETEWKMSNSLFKLYEPDPPDATSMDILFFHGLQRHHTSDAHLSTWKSGDALQQVWPQSWLPEVYPQARIISASYETYLVMIDTQGKTDLFVLLESLMSEITRDRSGERNARPVILVGHSFGGLLIKRLCLHAYAKRADPEGDGGDMIKFLDNVRGIFFYDTPHLEVDWQLLLAKTPAPVIALVNLLSAESAKYHKDFCQMWREKDYQWIIYGIGGSHSAGEDFWRFGDYISVLSDHFSICRPTVRNCKEYQHLIKLIESVNVEIQEADREFQESPKRSTIVGVESFLGEVGVHLRNHAIVGLSGISGSGKTTMARLLYNKLVADFQYTCFVDDLRTIAGKKEDVKKMIWLNMRRDGSPVPDTGVTCGEEWYQLTGRTLLLVFDDIAEDEHVEILEEIADDNGLSESRYIVTSRDTRLLRQLNDIQICPVPGLAPEYARKLLVTYAFPELERPPEKFEEVVEKVVKACDGLPLTLEILGNLLRRKQMEVWADVPLALRYCQRVACLEKGVWDKLMQSYEELGEEEKGMFLDVATFFIDSSFTPEEAEIAWSSLHRAVPLRVQTLRERSLIVNAANGSGFHMHEHLRRMGERIARELKRIWTPSADMTTISDGEVYPYDDEIMNEGGLLLEKVVAHRIKFFQVILVDVPAICA